MDGGGSMEYADHEVQLVGARAFIPSENANVALEKNTIKQPLSGRGLDSDELAELVAYRIYVLLESDQIDGTTQTQTGAINGEASVGINLTKDEHVAQAFVNAPTSESESVEFDAGDGTGTVQSFNYDEPGQLYAAENSVSPDISDPTGGAGGAGQMAALSDSGLVNMRDNFGSGPYVDKTDDITIFTELDHDNVVTASSIKVVCRFYWNVEQLPEGRASFSRP